MQPHHVRRWPFMRACAGLAALASALLAPAASHAQCHVKAAELPVHMVGSRAMTTVTINGHDVPLFVDTGAFFSFLTEAAASQLELPSHRDPNVRVQGLVGRVYSRVTTVKELKFSKGSLNDVDFVVGGNEMGSGAMGVIGRNLLNFADTEYDLAHGMIRFVFPNDDCAKVNMAYWTDDLSAVGRVDLLHDYDREFSRQPLRATASLNGKDIDVMFDTGATTTVSLHAARKAGVEDQDMTPEGLMYGAGRGSAREWTAAFDRFELGGETIAHNRLQVADFDMNEGDMLVGVDFFLSHHIYVSAQQKRMYFTYNGGPVFMLNKAAHASAAASPPADADPALDADGWLRRGAASGARGDYAGALADLDHACAMAPRNATCFTSRATAHEGLEQRDLALADLDTALRIDPRLADARIRRAWMLQQGRQDAPALADLDELDRTLPPQSQIRSSMADLFAAMVMPARVVAQLDPWIRFHPHDVGLADAYDQRCWSRVQLNAALDKALNDCDAAIDLDDETASHFDSRGWVRLRLGQWGKAKSDFDKALAIAPKTTDALYGRGIAQARLGNAGASQADFAAARKLRPDMDEHMHTMGVSADDIAAAHP
jgi:tetratricopeptide (TPR) repeat protein/predicted aspartyl protease